LLEVIEYINNPSTVRAIINEAYRIAKPIANDSSLSHPPSLIVSTRLKGTDPNTSINEAVGNFNEEELRNLLGCYSRVEIIYQQANGQITAERDDKTEFIIALAYKYETDSSSP